MNNIFYPNNIGIIYLDLDGVLVNFIGGCYQWLGKPWDSYKTKEEQIQRNKKVFESGPQFWESLTPMPDAFHLWSYVYPYSPSILTAVPSRNYPGEKFPTEKSSQYAREGKWEWIKRHFKVPYDRFHCVLREHKQEYATKVENGHIISNILIDDSPQNIKEWINNRGHGILHKNASESIQQLKHFGFIHS